VIPFPTSLFLFPFLTSNSCEISFPFTSLLFFSSLFCFYSSVSFFPSHSNSTPFHAVSTLMCLYSSIFFKLLFVIISLCFLNRFSLCTSTCFNHFSPFIIITVCAGFYFSALLLPRLLASPIITAVAFFATANCWNGPRNDSDPALAL
jgi:hypothetical protein